MTDKARDKDKALILKTGFLLISVEGSSGNLLILNTPYHPAPTIYVLN